eukprot:SAG31_NODE_13108_length_892_cov_0.977301_1_plen_204_part_10
MGFGPTAAGLIKKAVQNSLENFQYENAIFFAERLVASHSCDENLFSLASCYYQAGQVKRAYCTLKGNQCQTEANRYLFAKCCVNLGQLHEAERCLLQGTTPKGAAGLELLGEICKRTDRVQEANDYFSKALKLNPLQWTAYQHMCELGMDVPSTNFFHMDDDAAAALSGGVSVTFTVQDARTPNPSMALNFDATPGTAGGRSAD